MPDFNLLKKAVVKVQNRSAFDKSFRNLLTTKCGTLTPLLCDELIPNTTVNLKIALNCTLPPLASDTFMNVNLKAEAFFCPTRLVMQGFQDFIQGNDAIKYGNNDTYIRVPLVQLDYSGGSSTTDPYIGPGKLADYLGFRSALSFMTTNKYINALPFLVYHYIADCWYRNSLVQISAFEDKNLISSSATWNVYNTLTHKPAEGTVGYICKLNSQFRDGVKLGDLRQRNFGTDYFTSATPQPQNGEPQKISMALPSDMRMHFSGGASDADLYVSSGDDSYLVPTLLESGDPPTDTDGYFDKVNFRPEGGSLSTSSSPQLSFTIASLRAANSLQQWLERNNLANNRYVDFLKVQFNADLKDSIAQRPVYLGSASFPVYTKGIYQTAADASSNNNPFDSVGNRYGHAYSEGSSFIIDHFTAEEPGYLMVLVSLVPEVTYSSGVSSHLLRYRGRSSYGEMANPILQNVGPQPINLAEISDNWDDDTDGYVFGYTDRYADWMNRVHELHGLMRDGQTLESFALQRSLAGTEWGINSSFLRIPTNFMDQVTAVDSTLSNYGVWIDSYLDYKVVMPLARYSIPSLQDPAYEHGDTVVVDKRGRYID